MTFDAETRRRALWSTEAAAALGLSDRMTPAQLWALKVGATTEEPVSALPARLGLACQEGIAKIHAEDSGDRILALADVEIIREVNGVPIGSHFDYLNRTRQMLHEVKFFGMSRKGEFGAEGSDSVPYDVLAQCLHQMAAWNAYGCKASGYGYVEGVEVDVVFGNVERAVFVIPYDPQAERQLLQREAEFWALVQSERPPQPHNPEDCRRIWAKADGSERIATPEIANACGALSQVKATIKKLDAQKDALETAIQSAMAEAATLKAADGKVLATWNPVSAERVDVKRLKAERPEIAAAFINATATRRFLLK